MLVGVLVDLDVCIGCVYWKGVLDVCCQMGVSRSEVSTRIRVRVEED